jgi:hypothetical protein
MRFHNGLALLRIYYQTPGGDLLFMFMIIIIVHSPMTLGMQARFTD